MAIIPDQKTGSISFQTPQDKKRQKMMYALLLVIVITLGVIYFGFFSGGGEVSVAPISTDLSNQAVMLENDVLMKKLEGIKLNISLFQDKKFQSLMLFGQFPVNIGVKGRNNPFEPF